MTTEQNTKQNTDDRKYAVLLRPGSSVGAVLVFDLPADKVGATLDSIIAYGLTGRTVPFAQKTIVGRIQTEMKGPYSITVNDQARRGEDHMLAPDFLEEPFETMINQPNGTQTRGTATKYGLDITVAAKQEMGRDRTQPYAR